MPVKLTTRSIAALRPRDRPYDVRDAELNGFIARVRPSGTVTYLVQYRRPDGRQASYVIGQHGRDGLTPTLARDTASRVRLAARDGDDPHGTRREAAERSRAARTNTLASYIGEPVPTGGYTGMYWTRWLARRKSASAEAAVKSLRTHFGDWFNEPLAALDVERVTGWRRRQEARGLADQTIKRVQAELTVLMTRAVTDRVLDANPLGELPGVAVSSRANVRPRFLSPEEDRRLRAALVERDRRLLERAESGHRWRVERGYSDADALPARRFADHLHPLVLVSLNTGVRRGELFRLRWADLGADFAELNLRGETTKSKEPRSIPANAETRAALADWQAQTHRTTGLVFPGADGKPMTTLKTAWGALLRAAEIDAFRWHDLRHTFASWLVMRGVPLNTVRELLGHTSLEMTLRYAHLADTTKAAAVEALGR